MGIYNHPVDRNRIKWGGFGIVGKDPLRYIIIKDLTNSHLVNIIKHIQDNPRTYSRDVYDFMLAESLYRKIHHINVIIKFGR
jgi:hypothetical protein